VGTWRHRAPFGTFGANGVLAKPEFRSFDASGAENQAKRGALVG